MNYKKTVLFTLVLLLLLYLTGCGSYLSTSSAYVNFEEEANMNVYMDDADIPVDAEEIVLYIENTGEEVLSFGGDWHLEMLDGEEWKAINKRSPTGNLDVSVSQVAILCQPGEVKEAKINMSMYPYDFKRGTYRFIQETSSNKVIMVEFQMVEFPTGLSVEEQVKEETEPTPEENGKEKPKPTPSNVLWEIPYNTDDGNAITYIAQYGEWKTPLGLYSFALGEDKLFVDDSANQRIMVYEKNGDYSQIDLPENMVCDDMAYDEDNHMLYLLMYDYLAVVPETVYGVVRLDETGQGIEIMETSQEPLEQLDCNGEKIKSPMNYELLQELKEKAAQLWGMSDAGVYDVDFINQYEGYSLFCYSESKTAAMGLFFMKDGEIVAHTEWLEAGEFFHPTRDNSVYLYEKNGELAVAYLTWSSDSELEIVEVEFQDINM